MATVRKHFLRMGQDLSVYSPTCCTSCSPGAPEYASSLCPSWHTPSFPTHKLTWQKHTPAKKAGTIRTPAPGKAREPEGPGSSFVLLGHRDLLAQPGCQQEMMNSTAQLLGCPHLPYGPGLPLPFTMSPPPPCPTPQPSSASGNQASQSL